MTSPRIITAAERANRGRASSIQLGDMVAKVAQPIAKVIDRVAKTNLANCPGCKARQKFLNNLTSPKS